MFGHIAMDWMASSISLDEASNNVIVETAASTIRSTKPKLACGVGDGLQLSQMNDRQEIVGSHHPQDNLLHHHYPAIVPATLREHRNGVDEDGSPLRRYLCHHFKILKADFRTRSDRGQKRTANNHVGRKGKPICAQCRKRRSKVHSLAFRPTNCVVYLRGCVRTLSILPSPRNQRTMHQIERAKSRSSHSEDPTSRSSPSRSRNRIKPLLVPSTSFRFQYRLICLRFVLADITWSIWRNNPIKDTSKCHSLQSGN